jgi:FtsZ-binding cell division protein ZapB
MKRDNVNVMCSWIVTAPKDLPAEDNRHFFDEAYGFLSARYGGEKNIISSYVHMDEITPHMHFAFVPVVTDRRKDVEKVSAKECVTKKDLQTFHLDLERHMGQVFGREIGILNDATKDGNRTVAELKRQSVAQEAQDALERAKEVQDRLDDFEKQERALQGKIRALEGKLSGVTLSVEQIDKIPVKTSRPTFGGEDRVTVAKKDWDNLTKTAAQFPDPKLRAANKRLEEEKKALQKKNAELQAKIPSMTERFHAAGLQVEINELKRYIERIPDDVRQRMEQEIRQRPGQDLGFGR